MIKILYAILALSMLLSYVACGKINTDISRDAQETEQLRSAISTSSRKYDESDPSTILSEITNDFVDITEALTRELNKTFEAVGTTYKDYQKNKGLVDTWIDLVLSESDALFARTRENSIAYFKLIAADPDHKYSEFCDEALDKYYDTVYDKAMDEYYDSIYDCAMDNLYDEYYNGILDDAYDDIEYGEWSAVSSECYKTWSDASSGIYRKWSDESSYYYGLWSAVNSAFCWNDNFDVDAIVAEYETEKSKDDEDELLENITEEAESSTPSQDEIFESPSVTDNKTSDGLRPEFKEAMDSYEAFYDEYCALIAKYKANPTDMKLLADYSSMILKLSEMQEAFEAWEGEDLSKEELVYYLEVSNRITQKLIEVS